MASADHPSILIAEGVQLTQRVGHGAGGRDRIAPGIVDVAGGRVWRRVSAPYPTAKFQPILGYERKLAESDQSPIAYKPVLIEYLGQVSAPKRPKKQETLRRLPRADMFRLNRICMRNMYTLKKSRQRAHRNLQSYRNRNFGYPLFQRLAPFHL